jgi:5'-nucleotidase
VISGLRVSWDSKQPPGARVLGVWLQKEVKDGDHSDGGTIIMDGDEIKCEKGGRKYVIVTREYMAQGHDGFLPLKGARYLIDHEVGKMYSTLVRQYFLVSRDTSC